MPNARLIVCADASRESGTGHLMRTLAILQECKSHTITPLLISRCEIGGLKDRIESEGISAHWLPEITPTLEWLRVLESFQSCPVILDGYQFTTEDHRAILEMGHTLMILDDFSHLKRYECTFLLNPSLYADQIQYSVPPSTKKLLGVRYVPIRKEFLDSRKRSASQDKPFRCLLTLGGSDPKSHTSQVISQLVEPLSQPIEITIVMGPAYSNIEGIQQISQSSKHKYHIIQQPKSMAQLMSQSDFAISAAGTTAYELLFLKTPTAFLSIASNQDRTLEAIDKLKVGTALGKIENMDWKLAQKQLTALIDQIERKTYPEAPTPLIDGRGASRIVQTLFPENLSSV